MLSLYSTIIMSNWCKGDEECWKVYTLTLWLFHRYLASSGPHLADYVVMSLIQLISRITKLGWFDDLAHRELVEDTLKFLQATIDHYIIGLKILIQLVEELNIPVSGRTLPQHRKTAVSFRDDSLYRIFQISITALKQLQMHAIVGATTKQEASMGEAALTLCKKCIDFDFIGTNPDESGEDVGTVQIPTQWRDSITDGSLLMLLFEFYKTTEPPRSNLAMQCIVLLSSIRRSIFVKEPDRARYLQLIMNFIRDVLGSQQGLHHQENYSEFCRQLGRLKANYQLNELVRVDGYLEWIELAASFTAQSFQNWQWSANSIHYLLSLWGRLVAAVPYVRADIGAKNHTGRLQECVQEVVRSYIQSMIDSVETVLLSEGTLDDPLDDEGSLGEQLERLPVITRFEYSTSGHFILSLFDPAFKGYEDALQVLMSGTTGLSATTAMQQLTLLEGKLTWLVYIVGATVGGYCWSDASTSDGVESIDASLCRRVFQLAQGIDYRLTSTGGQGKCSPRLELALLYFFQVFRKMYIWEHNGLSQTTYTGIIVHRGDLVPSIKQKVFQRFFEGMGFGDHISTVNIIVTKIANNLKYWVSEGEVVGRTLQLFLDMSISYSSSRMLLSLDTIKFLISQHTSEHFPFLVAPGNLRNRTTFHATLARLIFNSVNDVESLFETFMDPILAVLRQLGSTQSFRQEEVKAALIGVCRDLRGVASSTHNRRTYGLLFDMLYPEHFPVFTRAANEWSDSPEVSTALLKFMHEFVWNKAQRLAFDQSSPNGILLFREVSSVVCAFGHRLTTVPTTISDVYKEKFKVVFMCLSLLTTALNGSYVNFGVFGLYNDMALDKALQTGLKLSLQTPLSDIVAYPKLNKAYYNFFEVLFRNHITVVLQLETALFTQVSSLFCLILLVPTLL